MKRPKVKKTRTDLRHELREQVTLLTHACQSYDKGFETIGKHIALSLRVLLHHQGNSQALLQQLGLRSKLFLSNAAELNPNKLASECPLCVMQLSNTGSNCSYLPLCALGNGPWPTNWEPFEVWWNKAIIKDHKKNTFNRRELVLNVADTDGGAHVDPQLDAAYADLSRNNSLGWTITSGTMHLDFPPPTMACIRQIAHELLETLQVNAKSDITFSYRPIQK